MAFHVPSGETGLLWSQPSFNPGMQFATPWDSSMGYAMSHHQPPNMQHMQQIQSQSPHVHPSQGHSTHAHTHPSSVHHTHPTQMQMQAQRQSSMQPSQMLQQVHASQHTPPAWPTGTSSHTTVNPSYNPQQENLDVQSEVDWSSRPTPQPMHTPPAECRTNAWMGVGEASFMSGNSLGTPSPDSLRWNIPQKKSQESEDEQSKQTNQSSADLKKESSSTEEDQVLTAENGSPMADSLSTASTAVEDTGELQQILQSLRDLMAQGRLFLASMEQQKKENAELREEMRKHNEVAVEWTSGMQSLSDHFNKHVRQCEKYFSADTERGSESDSESSDSEEERNKRKEQRADSRRRSNRDREKAATNRRSRVHGLEKGR